jgi:hypothetical protein
MLGDGKAKDFPAPPSRATMSPWSAAGIDFTERGVTFRKWPARPYVPSGIKQKMPRPVPQENTSEERLKN